MGVFHVPRGTKRKGDTKMKENTVKILTIHSSKGLESKNVIVMGARYYNDEEKRVAYVAATRARDRLYWCTTPRKTAPGFESRLAINALSFSLRHSS